MRTGKPRGRPPAPEPKNRRATAYAVLGVSPGSSPETIRAAFIELAKRYHLDSLDSPERSEEKMGNVSYAYGILKDPKHRKAYDAALALFPDRCKACGGKGLRIKASGISSRYTAPCKDCDGTGWEERT